MALRHGGLLDRHVGISTFTDERRFAADMESLLPKITIHEDDSIPADFPHSWIIVRATTYDGQTFEKKCTELKGQAGVPISRETRLSKFFDCVAGAISKKDAETVVAITEDMRNVKDIHQLMGILRNATPH